MELKKRIYGYIMIDFLFTMGCAAAFIMKVHYYYSAMIPIYFAFTLANCRILSSQSIFGLKFCQWIRIGMLFVCGLLIMCGTIMITTYHYGSWETLAHQANQYYHKPERRIQIQLLTVLSVFKFFIDVVIGTHQNDQVEMLEFKRLYRSQ